MKTINYWDYCLTESEYRTHAVTDILTISVMASCFILSPVFILYVLICKQLTKEVPDTYKIFEGKIWK